MYPTGIHPIGMYHIGNLGVHAPEYMHLFGLVVGVFLLIGSAIGYHIIVKPLKRKHGVVQYSCTAQVIRYAALFPIVGYIMKTFPGIQLYAFALSGAIFGYNIYQGEKKERSENE